jgi:hypothetical protein
MLKAVRESGEMLKPSWSNVILAMFRPVVMPKVMGASERSEEKNVEVELLRAL